MKYFVQTRILFIFIRDLNRLFNQLNNEKEQKKMNEKDTFVFKRSLF